MKTEQLSGAVQVAWYQDGGLAHMYFDDFEQEYERINDEVWKYRETSCKDLKLITLRGYSKGDSVTLKIPKEWDDSAAVREYGHIFFDAPIYARVYIVGTDEKWYIDEHYSDIYDTSREAFDKAIEKTDMPADIKERVQTLLGSQDYAEYQY